MKQAEGTEELCLSSCPSLCRAQDFIFYLQIFYFFFPVKKRAENFLKQLRGRGEGRGNCFKAPKHLMLSQFDINFFIHGTLGPSLLCRRSQTDNLSRKEGRFNRDPEIQTRRDGICNGCLSKHSLIFKLFKLKHKMFSAKTKLHVLILFFFFDGKWI